MASTGCPIECDESKSAIIPQRGAQDYVSVK